MTTSTRTLFAFLLVTFGLSALALAIFGAAAPDADDAQRPQGLVVSALVYLALFGWQPLVAVLVVQRGWSNPSRSRLGLRPAPRRLVVASAGMPIALGVLAGALGWALGGASTSPARTPVLTEALAASDALVAVLGFVVAALLIAAQCVAEEVGWRGWFLPLLMDRVGARAGLLLHGVVWGLWYSPVVFLSLAGTDHAALATLSGVVTCMLIGGLLGWLRIVSGSLVPAVVANSVVTTFAGIPLMLRGADVGVRAAIVEPAGWIPLALLLAVLLTGRGRRAFARGRRYLAARVRELVRVARRLGAAPADPRA